eukprot:gnl/Ergobibamus_cyprinoides/419.p1 GENE.gnl/Ergobibamus_cyprinoides/419~~gnl/Ergobibamus_cyprinoides/419.p1  ORF type:complete len:350 (+),score=95.13 gnl/Ergobibamus_cyprinoides/419:104-1153(+)
MQDISTGTFLAVSSLGFLLSVIVALCQTVVFLRQHARRSRVVKPSRAPSGPVQLAQTAFYVCLLLSTTQCFLALAISYYGITRDFDSAAYWDGGPCYGKFLWFAASFSMVFCNFSDALILVLLHYIYAATLDELGLAGRSRQLSLERRTRQTCRTAVTLLLLIPLVMMTRDSLKTYFSSPAELRDLGCIPKRRADIFSASTEEFYNTFISLTWAYISISLLLLLARNAAVAREAHKHRLPTYELYRSALSRIRVIIYATVATLGAYTLSLQTLGSGDGYLIQVPANVAIVVYNLLYTLYYIVVGFAFVHKPSNAAQRSTKITSPMMAAMESSFAPPGNISAVGASLSHL